MELTKHQQQVLDESINLLYKQKERIILIKGSAGVGKTFMLNSLIKRVKIASPNSIIYCTAPTHKAVSILEQKIDCQGVEFKTIHSALELKRYINEQNGTVRFVSGSSNPLLGVSLLIVDEASMLNLELLELIESSLIQEPKLKVVFVGDEKQLNPVGEEHSFVFLRNYKAVELTEIIRQGKGNPIIELSRNFENVFLDETLKDNINNDLGYTFSKDEKEIINQLIKSNGSNKAKYLAWTNKEVNRMNDIIRNAIYKKPKKIEDGEILVLNNPYKDFSTNQEVKVENLKITKKTIKIPIGIGKRNKIIPEEATLDIYTFKDGFTHSNKLINVIHEKSEEDYTFISNKLIEFAKAKKIHWAEYYKFIEKFAELKYNHALTVHKSQGSTYEHTIINLGDCFINKQDKELRRLLYTAITRASNKLTLFNIENDINLLTPKGSYSLDLNSDNKPREQHIVKSVINETERKNINYIKKFMENYSDLCLKDKLKENKEVVDIMNKISKLMKAKQIV